MIFACLLFYLLALLTDFILAKLGAIVRYVLATSSFYLARLNRGKGSDGSKLECSCKSFIGLDWRPESLESSVTAFPDVELGPASFHRP